MLGDYRVKMPIRTRFGDTDMLGHVNNAVYSTYFESGRLEYWAELNGGHSFENWPFILARSEIDFLAEAHAVEDLTLGIRVSRLGKKSFDLEYLLVRDFTAVNIDVWVEAAEIGGAEPLRIWQIKENNPSNLMAAATHVTYEAIIARLTTIGRSTVIAGRWLVVLCFALILLGRGVTARNNRRFTQASSAG